MVTGPVEPLFGPLADLLVLSLKIHRIVLELVVQGCVLAAVSVLYLALITNLVHKMLHSDPFERFLVQVPGKAIEIMDCIDS